MTESNHSPLSVHINADAQQVWVMLREPSRIAQWHGWELDSLEDEINEIYFTDATEGEDHRRLVTNGGDTFTLEPVGDGTQVTLERRQHRARLGDGGLGPGHHRGLDQLPPAAALRA